MSSGRQAKHSSLSLSTSIVVYKPDVDLLIRVLQGVHQAACEAGLGTLTIDLIDNDGSDDVEEKIRREGSLNELETRWSKLNVITPGENLGYGRGNNLSIGSSKADYHLVLNPDAVLEKDALSQGVAFMEAHRRAGLLVPKVLGFDGEMQFLCKKHPTLFDLFLRGFAPGFVRRIFARRMASFEMRDRDYQDVITSVPYPTGCFMLFRGEVLRSIGGFDERFFLYLEDADIGRRTLAVSDVAYVPSVVVHHRWTRGTHGSLKLRLIGIQSAIRYWRKWGGIF